MIVRGGWYQLNSVKAWWIPVKIKIKIKILSIYLFFFFFNRSNGIDTNYFTIFLQTADMINNYY